VAKVNASKGDETLHVIGHTDSTGPEEHNQGLSERRAAAVAGWLIEQGIPESRITTSGMGESQPVADNSTREGRAMNRRVEVKTK
jgi:OOP family OmpA-OmpF porin